MFLWASAQEKYFHYAFQVTASVQCFGIHADKGDRGMLVILCHCKKQRAGPHSLLSATLNLLALCFKFFSPLHFFYFLFSCHLSFKKNLLLQSRSFWIMKLFSPKLG